MIMKTKIKKQYTCNVCGYVHSKWFGQCPKCNQICSAVESEQPAQHYKKLASKTSLKSKSTLQSHTKLKAKTPLQSRNIKTMSKESYSIFTDDLYHCIITGDPGQGLYGVHVHHIFGGANKQNSERYGFLIPLRCDWHDMADYGIHFDKEFDLKYKRLCEEYWIENIGTQEEFIETFGMWW